MPEMSTANGVVLIDKPTGPTSHECIRTLRRQLKLQRIGHTGTLDPFASGLLVVALGAATRLIEYTHILDKMYETTIRLGRSSDTDDRTGTIVEHEVPAPPTQQDVTTMLARFTGTLQQQPPQYAAIKVAGKKLYEYARAGTVPTIAPRTVRIHEIVLQHYSYPCLELRVRCSTGTYIRALARDIGESLGTGGYADSLRRTAIGPFEVGHALSLEQVTAQTLHQHLLPPQTLVAHLPSLTLPSEAIRQLRQGQPVPLTHTSAHEGTMQLLDDAGTLVGIGRIERKDRALYPHKILTV